jgi:hypothetical protein
MENNEQTGTAPSFHNPDASWGCAGDRVVSALEDFPQDSL